MTLRVLVPACLALAQAAGAQTTACYSSFMTGGAFTTVCRRPPCGTGAYWWLPGTRLTPRPARIGAARNDRNDRRKPGLLRCRLL